MTQDIVQLTDVEHMLLRPDMYVGDMSTSDTPMYTYNYTTDTIAYEVVRCNQGLLKMFDELVTNAVDNYQKTKSTTRIDVTLDATNNSITVYNDGQSIPIQPSTSDPSVYIPELIFTRFRTGSNFHDDDRITGGKNGIGCKVVSVFSTEFVIDIVNNNTRYYQVVRDNTNTIEAPTIEPIRMKDYVSITFRPDTTRVGTLDDAMIRVLSRRVHDLTHLPLLLSINDTILPRHTWNTYVRSYKLPITLVYTGARPLAGAGVNWMIALGADAQRTKPVSFVNNITTYDGGTHVNYILNQVVRAVTTTASADTIKSKLVVFVYATICNPSFTGQAKERLTTRIPKDTCTIPADVLTRFIRDSQLMSLLTNVRTPSTRTNGLNIKKVVHAQRTGPKCTLFLCEGDSALAMCVRGISAMGRHGVEYFGAYPLRGKPLNTRNVSDTIYNANAEWTNIKNIIGLDDGAVYTSVQGLRYGAVVCVKDADADGASIMGLIINFFATKFPSLLSIDGFISEFITPMIKVGDNLVFYNRQEYTAYLASNPRTTQRVRYIKGLGTNEPKDVMQYFKAYTDNKLPIIFDEEAFDKLTLAFDRTRADDRKTWLERITPDTYLPRHKGVPIRCSDFIDNDLVLFSYDNCVRSIPSVADGLKPSQRKVLYTMRAAGATREWKVTELGGAVTQRTNYHHGDTAINDTIIKMAQDYVGANNVPLLQGIGSFGSRFKNGEDAAAARYISVKLHKLTALLFPIADDVVLDYRYDDDKLVEPYVYVPIVPMALVNGAEGIGTGWSTSIPPFDIKQLLSFTRRILQGECIASWNIKPMYRGFKGQVFEYERGWIVSGIVDTPRTGISGAGASGASGASGVKSVIIRELPVGKGAPSIEDMREKLKELTADGTVVSWASLEDIMEPSFRIQFANEVDVMKLLKLQVSVPNTNMVLFNASQQLHRYDGVSEIMDDWLDMRMDLYTKRIAHQLQVLRDKVQVLRDKVRFIELIIAGTLVVQDKRKDVLIHELLQHSFTEASTGYLLAMPIYSLTREHHDELVSELAAVEAEIKYYSTVQPTEIWLQELDALEQALA